MRLTKLRGGSAAASLVPSSLMIPVVLNTMMSQRFGFTVQMRRSVNGILGP
jgi:hypothetical protein